MSIQKMHRLSGYQIHMALDMMILVRLMKRFETDPYKGEGDEIN